LSRALRAAALLAIACSSGACFFLGLDTHIGSEAGSPDEGIDVVVTADAIPTEATADSPASDGGLIDAGGQLLDARFRDPCKTGTMPLFCTNFDTPDAFGIWNGGKTGTPTIVSGNATSPPYSMRTDVPSGQQAYVREQLGLSPAMTCIADIYVAHLDSAANILSYGFGGESLNATVVASPYGVGHVSLRLYITDGATRAIGGFLELATMEWVRVQLSFAQPPTGTPKLVASFAVRSQDAGPQLDATIDGANAPLTLGVGPQYVATPATSDQIFFDNVACDPGTALP
jgi:hypothetical protein